MSFARWTAFLLLPLLFALDRFGYYGLRSMLWAELRAENLPYEEVRRFADIVTWLMVATPPIGGLLALALKPRWTLLAGAVITAIGYAITTVTGPAALGGWVVIALGTGLVRPAVFACAALAARDPADSARGALFVALYGATNLAALFGALAGDFLSSRNVPDGAEIFSGTSALLMALAALLALGVALAPRFDDEREPPDPPFTGRQELAAAVLILLGLPSFLVIATAGAFQFPSLNAGAPGWFQYVNPTVTAGACLLLIAGLATAAYLRKRVPLLYIVAAGHVLFVMGCAPLLTAASGDESLVFAGALASLVLCAIAEPLTAPLLLSRLVGAVHPRAATLAVALWVTGGTALSQLLYMATRSLRTSASSGESAVLDGVLLALALGAAIVAAIAIAVFQWLAAPKLWPAPHNLANEETGGARLS